MFPQLFRSSGRGVREGSPAQDRFIHPPSASLRDETLSESSLSDTEDHNITASKPHRRDVREIPQREDARLTQRGQDHHEAVRITRPFIPQKAGLAPATLSKPSLSDTGRPDPSLISTLLDKHLDIAENSKSPPRVYLNSEDKLARATEIDQNHPEVVRYFCLFVKQYPDSTPSGPVLQALGNITRLSNDDILIWFDHFVRNPSQEAERRASEGRSRCLIPDKSQDSVPSLKKPFRCFDPSCGARFFTKESLRMHMEFNYPSFRYSCPHSRCHLIFHTRDKFSDHMRRKHDKELSSLEVNRFRKTEISEKFPPRCPFCLEQMSSFNGWFDHWTTRHCSPNADDEGTDRAMDNISHAPIFEPTASERQHTVDRQDGIAGQESREPTMRSPHDQPNVSPDNVDRRQLKNDLEALRQKWISVVGASGPNDNKDTIPVAVEIGKTLAKGGHHIEALGWYRLAFLKRDRTLSPSHSKTVRGAIAHSLAAIGRTDDARLWDA
ncbi:hypothetical protein FQN50_008195 [Emmonsiellopsis sp. PD_5]|nr:hypothetical protein FQN50_008195 [Emmonsiellopsis sp. PD_5]